ncbi:MAG TPA: ShlB/FhaC/HecB family hemolysin secretion/activation protein [Candidatus Methylacidiphilales bacterium]|nr:ShlB/FhaC/HecB family hemolysin secretion/activation protein [Candidatus Methylacidiphilales bacterium]
MASWLERVSIVAISELAILLSPTFAWASTAVSTGSGSPQAEAADASQPAGQKDSTPRFYIQEYRVEGGGHLLPRDEVEEAVYPYLGPYRTAADVEQARGALEQAYHDKGYETVSVQIPPQHARSGVIILHVLQGEVERLRVMGSRYFSPEEIRREAPSLQEGASPNFTQVTHDLVALNQLADRRVTPTLSVGEIPGTVDVDLNVKDTMPLHGSLEINNRYSAGTTPLRLNGSVSYDNLWQLEHSIGASFQLSPEDPTEVKVFSGYYLARIPGVDWLNLIVQGTSQDSSVNTLGGIGVVGKGDIIGGRAVILLPAQKDFYHSVSLGIDYKHFDQDLSIAGGDTVTPVTYYPFSAAYSGSWVGKGYETDLNASIIMDFRAFGSDEAQFEENRHGADASFIYFRGDLSHTRDLPGGFQLFVKGQGQASETPLVNSEQFSGGGLGTVRGYLESEELGDNGLFGSMEMRTPSLGDFLGKPVDEWRFYVFGDAGLLTIDDALPEQQEQYRLASVGAGTRIKFQDHYNGSFDVGLPLDNGIQTNAYEALLTFRVWAEF